MAAIWGVLTEKLTDSRMEVSYLPELVGLEEISSKLRAAGVAVSSVEGENIEVIVPFR